MNAVLPLITRYTGAALDLLLPRWCIGCGREGAYVCASCLATFTAIDSPVCARCGRPLGDDAVCRDCIDADACINGIRAPYLFDGLLRAVIHEFKYRNLRGLAPLLAGLLADYLSVNPVPGDVLVPVPLHTARLRERGYNQSALLAKELGQRTGLPAAERGLKRVRHTVPLARTATVTDRRIAVDGAFSAGGGSFDGKTIILIDDVSTSGATLDACARMLRGAGAKAVWGLVIALEL